MRELLEVRLKHSTNSTVQTSSASRKALQSRKIVIQDLPVEILESVLLSVIAPRWKLRPCELQNPIHSLRLVCKLWNDAARQLVIIHCWLSYDGQVYDYRERYDPDTRPTESLTIALMHGRREINIKALPKIVNLDNMTTLTVLGGLTVGSPDRRHVAQIPEWLKDLELPQVTSLILMQIPASYACHIIMACDRTKLETLSSDSLDDLRTLKHGDFRDLRYLNLEHKEGRCRGSVADELLSYSPILEKLHVTLDGTWWSQGLKEWLETTRFLELRELVLDLGVRNGQRMTEKMMKEAQIARATIIRKGWIGGVTISVKDH